jgi:hypothetical protein
MEDRPETGTGTLSELSIGVRELFRIVVPGAYATLLFEWLTAGKFDQISGEGRTLTRIAVSVLVGLIAYGLQVHEKWLPYNVVFEQSRSRLNERIIKIANASNSKDYVGEYKYFLETRAPEIKERIHYFTSFYYMLDEMSLISAIAAIALAFMFFCELNPDRPLSTHFVLVGIALQLFTLYRDPYSYIIEKFNRLDERLRWVLKYAASWLGITTIWIAWNWILAIYFHRMWPCGPLFRIDWRFWALISAAVIFERLGAKQWNSIIKEQIVLVNDKQIELRKVISAG